MSGIRLISVRRTNGRGRYCRRGGFTLLEILLTLVLASVLLGSLWELLSIYSRLFDTGQTKAENAQLTAGLLQQISDDLHAAIQDTAEAPPGTMGAVRRFGLFGSSKVLQVDVLATVWPLPNAPATPNPLATLDQPPPQAWELRTVRYTFTPPGTDEQVTPEARPGLTRQELDFETPYSPGSGPETGDRRLPPAAPLGQIPEDKPPDQLSLLESLAPDPNDDKITWLPEVVSLEFRYFDGAEWSSTWNSIERRSLPAAVEVLLEFKAPERSGRPSPPRPPQVQQEQQPMDLLALDAASTRPPDTLPCRLLVHLPTSIVRQKQAEAERMAELAARAPGPPPDDDSQLEALTANPTDPAEEAANLELARAFQGIMRDRPFARRRRAFEDPSVGRTLIDQPAPDQWMRAGPMNR